MARARAALGVIAAGLVLGRAAPAAACGGYFAPAAPDKPVVTDHRMAFSMSTTQSVLWDQIRYSGQPGEFAWVLPVKAGARLEVSRDAWFAALDAATQPLINPPRLSSGAAGGCGGSSTGCGSNGGSASGGGGVQVLNEGVAGIYETVTLRSTDPAALTTWLTGHGYEIPAAVTPTLGAYVAEGFDFIALRLRPDCGATVMQPVRIITPGADPSLPLRMVAAGIGAQVGITLYVLTEGRQHPRNFPDVHLDLTRLAWDDSSQTSNYAVLAQQALTSAGGYGWLTEYAGPPQTVTMGAAIDTSTNPGLADAYFGACNGLGSTGPDAAVTLPPPCDVVPPGIDAGAPPPSGDACAPFDDLALALTGLDPAGVWLTRLRSSLAPAALASGDLVLEPAPAQTTVSSVHDAVTYSGDLQPSACESAPRARASSGTWLLVVVTALGVTLLSRRRPR